MRSKQFATPITLLSLSALASLSAAAGCSGAVSDDAEQTGTNQAMLVAEQDFKNMAATFTDNKVMGFGVKPGLTGRVVAAAYLSNDGLSPNRTVQGFDKNGQPVIFVNATFERSSGGTSTETTDQGLTLQAAATPYEAKGSLRSASLSLPDGATPDQATIDEMLGDLKAILEAQTGDQQNGKVRGQWLVDTDCFTKGTKWLWPVLLGLAGRGAAGVVHDVKVAGTPKAAPKPVEARVPMVTNYFSVFPREAPAPSESTSPKFGFGTAAKNILLSPTNFLLAGMAVGFAYDLVTCNADSTAAKDDKAAAETYCKTVGSTCVPDMGLASVIGISMVQKDDAGKYKCKCS